MKITLITIMWFLWFLNFSSRSVFSPLLPVIEDELSISHTLAGSLFLFISIGFTISVFLSGLVSRYIGYKRTIIFCFLASISSMLLLRYADTYNQLAGFCFFIALTAGFYFPCAVPFITSIFDLGNWGKAITFHETAPPSSYIAVPVLVALGLGFFYWKTIFLILGGVSLVFIILFWLTAPDPRPLAGKPGLYSQVLLRKDFWLITLIWTISNMATNGIYNIVPLFLVKERGIPFELANTIFGFSRAGGLLATIILGFILDRYALKRILFTIVIVTGLSTIGLAVIRVFWILIGMLFIQATMCIIFFPASIFAISKLTTIEERGTFMGITMGIASIFGFGICPMALGMVADKWNFQSGILVLGILVTLSCIVLRGLKEL